MVRRLTGMLCATIAGMLSFAMSGYGSYMLVASGLNQNSIATFLFCFLPMLSFPVCLFSLWKRKPAAVLHCMLAAGYLAAFTALNWRTCSEHGICSSVAATTLETLTTHPMETMLLIAVFALCSTLLDRKSQSARLSQRV